ncbi:MAG: hypothetical protein RLO81_02675 [Fulvivirga sp.]|uniref:hypothetical protein n=1 Tax=Fulvivirga sp. TaxID=1931237 RepID=UPI0032EF492C
MNNTLLTLLLFFSIACSDKQDIVLHTNSISDILTYNQLLQQIGKERLYRSVEEPNVDGSLGRNKDGYFHVRFQINMTTISDYVIVSEDIQALETLYATIAYAFQHQESDGGFELVVPEEILNASYYTPPGPGDLLSGTAFFASSLGLTLMSLDNSQWYNQSAQTRGVREAITFMRPQFENMLNYLMSGSEILIQMDAQAPNRLLFDALAYYSLGEYLTRNDAIALAHEFMHAALAQTDTVEGYFIEGGGWDSSYNGVAIKLAMELYLLTEDTETKVLLKSGFLDATVWQLSRISANGEISTEGNTRVYEGGESFLGAEKGVDYVKVAKALLYFGYLTCEPAIVELGDAVIDYYN